MTEKEKEHWLMVEIKEIEMRLQLEKVTADRKADAAIKEAIAKALKK